MTAASPAPKLQPQISGMSASYSEKTAPRAAYMRSIASSISGVYSPCHPKMIVNEGAEFHLGNIGVVRLDLMEDLRGW